MPQIVRSFASGTVAGAFLALTLYDSRRVQMTFMRSSSGSSFKSHGVGSISSVGSSGSSAKESVDATHAHARSPAVQGDDRRRGGGHSNGENHRRRTSLPNAGDLAAPGMLASALKARASPDGEIIFMLTDESHVRLALNLILNLEELRLSHHLVVASTATACDALWARARQLKLSIGCGTSSFLQRGSSTAAHDAGLRAYGIGDSHVYHLWWQRWFFLSEAVGLGYNVLSLDTDISLRANPYPLLHGALAHHSLLTGLDNDASVRPFYFPAANVGFVYAHGGAGSAAHWVLAECRRRLERFARGEVFPLPLRQSGQLQQLLWDQDTFKDVLETAVFTPAAPSYRHAMLHCIEVADGGLTAGRRAPANPPSWKLQIERVTFFPGREAMPSAWMPLHLPPPSGQQASWVSSTPSTPATPAIPANPSTSSISSTPSSSTSSLTTAAAIARCNGSDEAAGAGGLYDFWAGGRGEDAAKLGGAVRNGSMAAVPMWLFSTYMICPHGGVCDGRWGWPTAPVLMGHFVGSKAKFWLMRILGWWYYDAGRLPSQTIPLPSSPQGVQTTSSSYVTADPDQPLRSRKTPVFPSSAVRPLVLRGHDLTLGKSSKHVKQLRRQLAHWALLAIALGRRAVLPLVTCDIPTPEVPDPLRNSVVLIKLTDRSLCGPEASHADWRMPPTAVPLSSHDSLRVTAEMGAFGDYRSVFHWPPKHAESCCQLVPELKCIDRYADSGELADEMLLCERDLGWIDSHEDAAEHRPLVVRAGAWNASAKASSPLQPLSLAHLADFGRRARTLVIDLGLEKGLGVDKSVGPDPLHLLPPLAEVVEVVRAKLQAGARARATRTAARHGKKGLDDEAAPRLSFSARRCLQRLVDIANEQD